MKTTFGELDYHRVAAGVLVGLYGLNMIGFLFPEYAYNLNAITNVHGRGHEATIELVEALLWMVSTVAFGWLTWVSWRTRRPMAQRIYFLVFLVLCFVATGEEISWGQHLGLVDVGPTMQAINAQGETNLHNLNIAKLIGLQPDHFLYNRLDNFNKIVNPSVYLFLIGMWLFVPWMQSRLEPGLGLVRSIPIPSKRTSIFFACNLLAYVIVDRIFDVGELFEFAVAITMLMFGAEMIAHLRNLRQEKLNPLTID